MIEVFTNELAAIVDLNVRTTVRDMLLKAPVKFWAIPASSSGKYHAEDECQIGGNVLHTRRVVGMVQLLARAYDIDQINLDICIAAALIHDMLKQGPDMPWPVALQTCSKREYNMHGPNLYVWYAESIGELTLAAADILDIASRHMGIWSSPAFRPNDACSNCLAMADYVASRKPLAAAIPLAGGPV